MMNIFDEAGLVLVPRHKYLKKYRTTNHKFTKALSGGRLGKDDLKLRDKLISDALDISKRITNVLQFAEERDIEAKI